MLFFVRIFSVGPLIYLLGHGAVTQIIDIFVVSFSQRSMLLFARVG
jgi:hypothetical protein